MFFNQVPLRNKILKLIVNNPVPLRNTDILSPYLILSITFFFNRYKSVIVNELYFKGLIDLHGDVDLFMKAKRAKDTKYLRISASLTAKGKAYYQLHVEKPEEELDLKTTEQYTAPAAQPRPKRTLNIVR